MQNDLNQQHANLVKSLELYGLSFSAANNLKLERIEHLLKLLDNPEQSFRIIHVGGTSGKGSVSTLINNILINSGYKTGLFTSPYLQVINEICQINNTLLQIEEMTEILEEIKPHIKEVEQTSKFGCPSYFEVLLAVSLMAFARNKVDFAVIEVGLGGTLDATNCLPAEKAILVSVGLDHIEILGDTIEKIAADKVGIIKPDQEVICGFIEESVREIAVNQSEKVGAIINLINKDFSYHIDQNKQLSIKTPENHYKSLNVKCEANYQAHNVALALLACEDLVEMDIAEYQAVVAKSIEQSKLPGRSEVICNKPLTILDGAHNSSKISGALEAIKEKIQNKDLVIIYATKQPFSNDQQINNKLIERQNDIYKKLAGAKPDTIIFTNFEQKGIWYPTSAGKLAADSRQFMEGVNQYVIEHPELAYEKAKQVAGDAGAILVIGSFHLVGDIRNLFISKEQLLAT